MLTKEELDSWNEIFSECRISEKELLHPTEAFLTRALIAYLNALYRGKLPPTAFTKLEDQSSEKRQLLVWITKHVDHILKITNKTYGLVYYDLICPSPKKTQHVLGILLNYLYYYNMYQTTVCKDLTGDRISQLEQLQRRLSDAKAFNDQCRQRNKEINEKTALLNEQLPEAKKQLQQLENQQGQQSSKIAKLQQAETDLNTELEQLSLEARQWQRQQVTEQEADDMRMKYKKLQATIEQLTEEQMSNEASYQQTVEQMNELEQLGQSMELAQQMLSLESVEDVKSLSKTLKAKEDRAKQLTLAREEKYKQIDRIESEGNALAEEMQKQQKQYEHEHQQLTEAINNARRQCRANAANLLKLKKQVNEELDPMLQDQQDIADFIDDTRVEIMRPYVETVIDNTNLKK